MGKRNIIEVIDKMYAALPKEIEVARNDLDFIKREIQSKKLENNPAAISLYWGMIGNCVNKLIHPLKSPENGEWRMKVLCIFVDKEANAVEKIKNQNRKTFADEKEKMMYELRYQCDEEKDVQSVVQNSPNDDGDLSSGKG